MRGTVIARVGPRAIHLLVGPDHGGGATDRSATVIRELTDRRGA